MNLNINLKLNYFFAIFFFAVFGLLFSAGSASATITGAFTSRVFDVGANQNFGKIVWTDNSASVGGGSSVTMQVRSGNLNPPTDGSWTSVSSGGSLYAFNNKRYIQYKATLNSTSDNTQTPTLQDVTIYYESTFNNSYITGSGASAGIIMVLLPSAVININNNGGASQTAQITWSAPSSNGGAAITGYNVYCGTGSNPQSICTGGTNVAGSPYNATGLNNGTLYYFRVVAVNTIGEGVSSETSVTPSTTPGAVTSLVNNGGGNSTAQITWSAPADNGGSAITGYNVYCGTGSNPQSICTGGTNVAGSPYNATGLNNGTLYYFRVAAINTRGEGTSSETSVTPGIVVIGTQTWMAYNMNVGTLVVGTSTQGTSCASIQKYCYSNNEANCTTDGGLYQWDQAMCGSTTAGAQGICPSGYHIPTDAEQYTLENYLKDGANSCASNRNQTWACDTAGTKLKTGGSSGFNAILTGDRMYSDGTFENRNSATFLWSSGPTGSGAPIRTLGSSSMVNRVSSTNKGYGASVRCIKD